MAHVIKLRVIVDDSDFRRLELHSGMPNTLTELRSTISQSLGIQRNFRILFMDPDFNNELMNAMTVHDIQDRSTIKLVYIRKEVAPTPSPPMQCGPSTSSQWPPEASASHLTSPGLSSLSSLSSELRAQLSVTLSDSQCAWPRHFPLPRFPYNVEVQLQRGNEVFRENGSLLKVTPGLKSDIMGRLAESIFHYTAYPQNDQIDEVAAALIKKFPCLKGYSAWAISLKYKMVHFRAKLANCRLQCQEVPLNLSKNKANNDDCFPATKKKKRKKAEVNSFPSHPADETDEGLEKLRLELLQDVNQNQSAQSVREKMLRTFTYRRREVLMNNPSAGEMKSRWPTLFSADEVKIWILLPFLSITGD